LLLAFVCFGVKKQFYKIAKPDKQSTMNEFQLTPPFVAIDFFFLSLDIKVNESSNMST